MSKVTVSVMADVKSMEQKYDVWVKQLVQTIEELKDKVAALKI